MKQLVAFMFAWWFLYQPIGDSGYMLAGPFQSQVQCEVVRAHMSYTEDCFVDNATLPKSTDRTSIEID